MATVDLSPEAIAAAQAEADRRGVDVAVVIEEAVRRYVATGELSRLLGEFDERDAAKPDALTDDEAMQIAREEVEAVRAERRSGS